MAAACGMRRGRLEIARSCDLPHEIASSRHEHARRRLARSQAEAFMEAGGVVGLVAYASQGTERYQEEAAWALASLSAKVAHALYLLHAGALP